LAQFVEAVGDHLARLYQRATQRLLERVDGAGPDVEDLLIDAHREARVRLAHDVHRTTRRRVADAKMEAKVLRSVCGVICAIGGR
jgi:hypothetical protein